MPLLLNLPVSRPCLELRRAEVLDQVTDRFRRPEPVGVGRDVGKHFADHEVADGGPP